MRDCKQWEKYYLPYTEGSLRGRKLKGMRRHLLTCESCKVMLRRLAALSRAAKTVQCASPPADLETAISSRVAHLRAQACRPLGWRLYETLVLRPLHSPLTAIAAACLSSLAMLGLLVHAVVVNPELAPRLSELLSKAATRVGGWPALGAIAVGVIFLGFDLLGLAAAPLVLKSTRSHKELHACCQ